MVEENNHQTVETEGEQADVLEAAREYGIDVAMLRSNLKRDPAQRIRRHQIALETAEKLRKAQEG